MKKFITFFFSLNILLSPTPVASAKTFSDINTINPHFKAITFLSGRNIINGYADGTFGPDQEITRAELLKMILESAKIEIKNSKTNCFPDAGYLEWFNSYLCTAKNLAYVTGYEDGGYKPNRHINKAETLKIIAKVYKWKTEFDETPATFQDTPKDAWYSNYALYGISKRLFSEIDATDGDASKQSFQPGKYITRSEVAEILYRYLLMSELNKDYFYPDLEKLIPKTQTKQTTTTATTSPTTLANGEIKVVLNWQQAEKPTKPSEVTDLDSHLLETYQNEKKEPVSEEIYFLHKIDTSLDALLEINNTNEVLTLRKLKSSGTYEYFVNLYNGNATYAHSKATVQITDKNGIAKFYQAPEGSGKIWKVFEINEKGEITDVNQVGDCNLVKAVSTVCPHNL